MSKCYQLTGQGRDRLGALDDMAGGSYFFGRPAEQRRCARESILLNEAVGRRVTIGRLLAAWLDFCQPFQYFEQTFDRLVRVGYLEETECEEMDSHGEV